MTTLRYALSVVLVLLCTSLASARGGYVQPYNVQKDAVTSTWSWNSDVIQVANSHLGQGNFIGLPGPWCADFVSFILRATGRRPLPNRMAGSALAYGPLELHPRPGDLVVMAHRRTRYAHVGFVIADLGDRIEMVSGNWHHRVSQAVIDRRSVAAFIRL
jgi:uncharacterized protein (TIGR02594 family)